MKLIRKISGKGGTFIICIALPLFYFFVLILPLEQVIKLFSKSANLKEISSIFKALILLFFFFLASSKYISKPSFLAVFKINKPFFLLLFIISPLSIGLLNLANFSARGIDSLWFSIYLTSVMFKALAEEIAFRGFLFHYLCQKFVGRKSILRAALLSSGIFALMHFINLRHYDIWSIINQVIAAFCFGVFFCSLVYKLSNIYIIGFFHGMINFLLSPQNPLIVSKTYQSEVESLQGNLSDLIEFSALMLPMLIAGFLILWNPKVKNSF